MADEAELEARRQKLDRTTELIAAFILSVAALLSSYSGFQAELWDGDQAANYTLAEQMRTTASKTETVSGQKVGLDTMLFTQWLDAYVKGETKLEEYYRQRFRPQFHRAFERWMAMNPQDNPDAPPTPFALPDYNHILLAETKKMQTEADRLFEAGQRANEISDAYGQATVILALSLFMGGIVQAFNAHRLRVALLTIASLACVLGIIRIASLPAIRLI